MFNPHADAMISCPMAITDGLAFRKALSYHKLGGNSIALEPVLGPPVYKMRQTGFHSPCFGL